MTCKWLSCSAMLCLRPVTSWHGFQCMAQIHIICLAVPQNNIKCKPIILLSLFWNAIWLWDAASSLVAHACPILLKVAQTMCCPTWVLILCLPWVDQSILLAWIWQWMDELLQQRHCPLHRRCHIPCSACQFWHNRWHSHSSKLRIMHGTRAIQWSRKWCSIQTKDAQIGDAVIAFPTVAETRLFQLVACFANKNLQPVTSAPGIWWIFAWRWHCSNTLLHLFFCWHTNPGIVLSG